MEHPLPTEGPAFGIVNAESVMEGIQTCHVSLEESRLRLVPLVKILDANDDDMPPGSSDEEYTDGELVHQFLECIERIFGSIDTLMVRLVDSGLVSPDENNERKQNQEEESVHLLMASNCVSKSSQFIGHHCCILLEADSLDGSGPLDDDSSNCEEGARIQPCMARLAELALRAAHTETILGPPQNHDLDEDEEDPITLITIVEAYSQYQRRCLRTRSKPAISSIAELRRVASSQNCYVSDILEAEKKRHQVEVGFEEGDDNEGSVGQEVDGTASRGQPHAQAITVILGEASSLIQPLAAWRHCLDERPKTLPLQNSQQCENGDIDSLLQQLCREAIKILDNEAQTLAVTVGSWFGSDQRGVASLDHENTMGKDATKSDLLSIETSLEEMAFLCQVVSRYCLFSGQTLAGERSNEAKLQNLLTEQSLHYSTLETKLATLQFNQALSLASPQLIELGRPSLKVPSIVEDAHFICVRAIERAAGTRSERAVWTVGHWVCELWGVDQSGGMMGGDVGVNGVYRALKDIAFTEGQSNGHDLTAKSNEEISGAPSNAENAFAAALLEATDENGSQRKEKDASNPGSGHNSAPASGGGLTSFFSRGGNQQSLQSQIDAELCTLNGISAAATACSALSGLFADLVEEKSQEESANTVAGEAPPKSSSMLTFSRDELASHSRSYLKLLQQRVSALVSDLCGGNDIFDCDGQLCLQNLRLFIEKEIYDLDSSSFRSMEGEDRIEAEMIGPIRRSQIFDEIGKDKISSPVVLQMAEAMSQQSADILLQILFRGQTEFNEWGAMLLSKQVRMLQNLYCSLVLESSESNGMGTAKTGATSTSTILAQFERVNQAVSILQLEKPSDWLAFAYKVGHSGDTNLTSDEIRKVMGLRVDFSEEAINNAMK